MITNLTERDYQLDYLLAKVPSDDLPADLFDDSTPWYMVRRLWGTVAHKGHET